MLDGMQATLSFLGNDKKANRLLDLRQIVINKHTGSKKNIFCLLLQEVGTRTSVRLFFLYKWAKPTLQTSSLHAKASNQ